MVLDNGTDDDVDSERLVDMIEVVRSVERTGCSVEECMAVLGDGVGVSAPGSRIGLKAMREESDVTVYSELATIPGRSVLLLTDPLYP